MREEKMALKFRWKFSSSHMCEEWICIGGGLLWLERAAQGADGPRSPQTTPGGLLTRFSRPEEHVLSFLSPRLAPLPPHNPSPPPPQRLQVSRHQASESSYSSKS